MRKIALLLGAATVVALSGCGGPQNDPNYTTDVTLTPEQQQAEQRNMAGQQAPGHVDQTAPGTLKVPGKSGG
jgi:hypothetical protein